MFNPSDCPLSCGSGGWSAPRPGREDLSALPELQLYDLDADPGETDNVQGTHPEVVEELKSLLAKHIRNGRSTPGVAQANDAEIEMVKPVPPVPAKGKKK